MRARHEAAAPLRDRYALEVSSPGPERPLTKPEHFRASSAAAPASAPAARHDERRAFTGELVGATDADVTVAAADGVVSIPYAEISRSNLVGD